MKQVIYVDINEEVTSVYDRIRRLSQKRIYLVIPRKAVIFQSGMNLRILKGKLEGKELIIVTTDRTGRHLAEKVGIPVIARIEVNSVQAPDEDEGPKMRIEPIQARKNEVVRDTPRRIEKKMTIGELIREFREKSGGKKEVIKSTIMLSRQSPRFIVVALIFSVTLFFLITYVALPGATIYISPKFDTIGHAVNVLLADKRKNQNLLGSGDSHVIASQTISTVVKQTKFFNTTSKRFDGVNASGQIKVINAAKEQWELKGGTRFQSPEGLIFRSSEAIFVPAAIESANGSITPGEYTVKVQADPFDPYDQPVGERGNIPPAKFSIPGLSKYSQQSIWGESSEPMQGGVTKYSKVVMQEDIEAAKRQLEDNLILTARDELRARLDDMNQLNNTNLVLLDVGRYLKTNLDQVRVSDGLVGSTEDKFEVFVQISAEGVAYDFDKLFTLLKEELRGRSHPDMQIREESINPDMINYEAIDENETLGQIKITATVQGIQEYVIESSLEAGVRFAAKVKERIAGLPTDDALAYIINLPEVDTAEIKTWPFWVNNIPRLPENIDIQLLRNRN